MAKDTLGLVAWILVVIGALNWGLVGVFNLDLVAAIFGGTTAIASKVVYILVGVAALVVIAKKSKK